MIIYLIKLILILVFNIGANINYIYSECKCCCNNKSREIGSGSKGNLGPNPPKWIKTPKKSIKPSKVKTPEVIKHKPNNDHNQTLGTNTSKADHRSKGGGIQGDKFEIDLNNHTLKCNGNRLTEFKKIETVDLTSINPQRVINAVHNYDENIYYTIDKNIFNSIKEDSNVEIIKNSNSDTYIVFAVKTQVEGFSKENPKYDYYIVYCHNGNSTEDDHGLFDKIDTNVEIKILCSGNSLNCINFMFFDCKNLKKIIFTTKGLNTSNVNNMGGMFNECKNLEELDLSTFNTNNVKYMYGMFSGCSSLKKLNLSNFNTNNETSMHDMFYGCNELIGNVTTNDKKIKKIYAQFIKED